MKYDIQFSSSFKKSLKKQSSHQDIIKKRLAIFFENPHDPRLKTHKLSGQLDKYWSFSINYHLRVLFEFIDDHVIGLIDIGTHEIYKK